MARRRRGKAKRSKYGALAFLGMLPILGSIPGPIVMGYTVYSNVATKSYVDEKFEESVKRLIEHSDNNRQLMRVEMSDTLNSLRTHDAVIDSEIVTLKEQVRSNSQWIETKQTTRRQ